MNFNRAFVDDDKRPKVYEAIYDFVSGSDEDLNFNKHDKFVILENHGNDWLKAKNLATNEVGYISRKFIAIENSLESQPWYFPESSRLDAEFYLLGQRESKVGTFLVRPRNEHKSTYALSVRTNDGNGQPLIKHYVIYEEEGGVFISANVRSSTLVLLISRYMDDHLNQFKLLQRIIKPCHKPMPHIFDLSEKYVKNWEIDQIDITIIKRIAEGAFSSVDEGKWKGKSIAIKTLKQFNKEDFDKEIAVLKNLKHENIITLYGTCKNKIIFEHSSRGTLELYVKKYNITPFNLLYIAVQIASGMKYLESRNVIHRDLAARNILITEHGIIKIIDFGLSRTLNCHEGEYCMKSVYPLRWSAIECFKYGTCNIKSDVWSFGIVLMELYTRGSQPYAELKTNNEVKMKIDVGYRMKKVPSIPDNIYKIMIKCWQINPEDRPSFHDLKISLENFGF